MYKAKTEHGLQIQIKEDDKFFCRLLSKENASLSIPSFRLSQIAVPFVWESQPGTPKHSHSLSLSHHPSLPPLTPPPSFYNHGTLCKKPIKKNPSRSKLVRFLFPKLNLDSSSSSLSLSSSSYSSSSDSSRVNVVPGNGRRRRRRFLSCDSSVHLWGNGEDDDDDGVGVRGSTSSRFCFGIRRTANSNGGSGGCCRRQA